MFGSGSLADYLGFPIMSDADFQKSDQVFHLVHPWTYNFLPFVAYQFIWDEFYRDQNYCNKVVENSKFFWS